MDTSQFDRLVRTFGLTRSRRVATALLGAVAAWPLISDEEIDAKKKKKK